MNIRPVNNINYKGVPIAEFKVKGEQSCYKIFELNHKDKDFLRNLYQKVELKKLMPNLLQYDYVIWDEIFKNALKLSESAENKSFLETCNNIPCGALTYKDIKDKYHLSYVATIPTEAKKRVPFAGQILFNELFNRFIDYKKRVIELSAIRNAPFSPISTYLKLGFGMRGGDDYSEYMGIGQKGVTNTLFKQKEFITRIPIENNQVIDLSKELKLDYKV